MSPLSQNTRQSGEAARKTHRASETAFTLIEILVASAVLALLVALLATSFSRFVGVTSTSGKRLGVSNQTRSVFDRMAFDLKSSIRNSGMEITFLKNKQATGGTGTLNDSMTFLVNARTPSASSRFARVGYEVDDEASSLNGTSPTSLMRCVEPFLWTDSIASPSPTSNAEKQVFGRGVFRFELSFLKTDGTIVSDPPVKQSDISAVICSTASLDESSFAKLSFSERTLLASMLPDSVNGSLPLSVWNVGSLAGLPRPVMQHVRFNQRIFNLQ